MAEVIFAERALADLDRLFDFLLEKSPEAAAEAQDRILEAIGLLARHPNLGRPTPSGRRELVISWGRTGYVALYRFRPDLERVLVLTVRHQREVLPDDEL